MQVPENLIALLRRERKFLIATHINPEGDALGSSLALSMALESMGKETVVFDRDPVPESYRFLPGHGKFTTTLPSLISKDSPLILLDCNDLERAGLENIVVPFAAVIDHHETERGFGDIRWIEPRAAATGMMVYALIKELGVTITRDMATNLYASIAIDTGTFRYSNVTPEVLRTAADLVESGADASCIAVGLYETWSSARFRLLIDTLNTLEVHDGLAITVVTRDMFRRTGSSAEDTENFSNFPRMMRDIKVSALFRQTENGWKVSLRSKGSVNVALVAAEFQGGGHRNAAGYRTEKDLETAKIELKRAIGEMWKRFGGE